MNLCEIKVHPYTGSNTRRQEATNEHPLKPILNSLTILGLNIEEPSGPAKKMIYHFYHLLIILCFHYWALSDIVWYFRNYIQEDTLAESVTVWASVVTVDLMILKRKSLLKVILTVKKETEKLNSSEQRKYRHIVWIVCLMAWTFIVVFITQNLVFNIHVDYDKYFSNTPLYFFYHTMSKTQRDLFIRMDRSIETFYIQGVLTMIIGLYVLLCINAKMWFKNFNLNCESMFTYLDSTLHVEDVRCFKATFDNLAKNVKRLDNVFCQIVAMWLLMILVILCVRILFILNPLINKTDMMIEVTVLALSRAITTLFAVSFTAGDVYKESKACLNKLDAIIRKKDPIRDVAVYHEVQLAFTIFSFFPVHLTVWKFSSLNKAFLMTCIGMMTTYIIICIQLNPNALKSLIG
ncbi:uncharacterized protein CDAR_599661 [Caerostris darwini]|uniref:Gustatory receptor n=1 Tax=Caerostris darwini TaxID=1538125 RepID=A0AAV4SF14_9ARAC|nr:uncharacterized protein CDAR_599661 [Caerostris darwini]